jgi:uncharacterized protein (DUF1501 family)
MAGYGFGAAAFGTMIERLARTAALAQGTDYKALVCIFLFGGNDGNNTVIPYDTYGDTGDPAGTSYASTRLVYRGVTTGLGIPLANLAGSVIPTSIGQFALHPSLATTTGGAAVYPLWAGDSVAGIPPGRLNVVSSVGTLVQSLTRAQYQSSSYPKPSQLYSHSDQQQENMNGYAPSSTISTGIGGRILDVMYPTVPNFPGLVSVSGNQIFGFGARTSPLAVPDSNTQPNNILVINGPKPPDATGVSFNQLRMVDNSLQLVAATSKVMDTALAVSQALVAVNPDVAGFPNTTLGRQLKQVARLILLNKTQPALNLPRQIFFVSVGGFDTHQNQNSSQGGYPNGPGAALTGGLLAQLSQAMRAFHDWTVNEPRTGDISAQVTTFTLSDFSRTFQPSGTGAGVVGTDHAWATNGFVMGGALKTALAGGPGDMYGIPRDPTDPTTIFPYGGSNGMALGGLSDGDGGSNPRGRFIPNVAIEQYANTLAAWFGLPQDFRTLNQVFPNLVDASGNTRFNPSLVTGSPFNLGFI